MVNAKKAKDEHREKARELAAKQYKPGKERNWFAIWTTAIVVIVFAVIAGVVTVATLNEQEASKVASSKVTPRGTVNDGFPVNADGLISDAEPYSIDATLEAAAYDPADGNTITIFSDTACPHCNEFDTNNNEQIKRWMEDGTIDVVNLHPVAFLTNYSAEGANAIACVAEYSPESVFDAQGWLVSNQQEALTGKKLVTALVKEVGVKHSDGLEKCIRGGKYDAFVAASSERAQTGPVPGTALTETGITGTPSVFVNGERYPGDPDAAVFASFVFHVLDGGTAANWAGDLDITGETSEVEGE